MRRALAIAAALIALAAGGCATCAADRTNFPQSCAEWP